MTALVSMLVALTMAGPAAVAEATNPSLSGAHIELAVPYLPQTEALCGGAAAAMLFRYWGDRHADTQQFAALVDRKAGGISDADLVTALRDRQWQTEELEGSIDTIRRELARSHPLILLIEERPSRYHYVVTVGMIDDAVLLHDPAWGPSRRMSIRELLRRWKPTGFWTLLVLPQAGRSFERALESTSEPHAEGASATECDTLIDTAVAEIRVRGTDSADAILERVRTRCPRSSRPLSELSGVRFGQKRWQDAQSLAQQAVTIDRADRYAWDVLGSSRFMQDDLPGALRAWNEIDKPRLDSVQVTGLAHTRYSVIADVMAFSPNALLTESAYRRAERRISALPIGLRSRLAYRPDVDGFAVIDAAIVERSSLPQGALAWTGAAVRAAINRELSVGLPISTGQGDMWTTSVSWWERRPAFTLSYAAPRLKPLPGIWRVDAGWDAQSYAIPDRPTLRESHMHGRLSVADWPAPDLRYEVAAGIESWNHSTRAISLGGSLERRWLADRVGLIGAVHNWIPVDGTRAFRTASVEATVHSSTRARLTHVAAAGFETATASAPLSLWPGGGDGHGRPILVRAHPLLGDGVVRGLVFGRQLSYGTIESQWWRDRPVPVAIGLAAFVDGARTWNRLAPRGAAFQLDAGVGLRLRLIGGELVRLDYAHGMRDGRDAVTVGITRGRGL